MSTTKYFHLKLMILVFVIDMVHCMNIQIICLSLVLKKNSKRDKSFLEDLSKRFKLKSVCTTKGENNTEKTYDDLVLNNKKVIMCFTKMQNKRSLVIAVKMFFRKQKSCLF